MKVLVYHGQYKAKLRVPVEETQLVLTTYETVARAWKSTNNALGDYSWFRIILDEGALSQSFS